MTEPKVETGRPAAEGKRPWGTPRIILSEFASRSQHAKTSHSPVDHIPPGGSTLDGPTS